MADSMTLRALAEAATPGPWFQDDDQIDAMALTDHQTHTNNLVADCGNNRVNAAYIAACSPDRILALLDAIPEDPWLTRWGTDACYSCDERWRGSSKGHALDCAWVRARAAMDERP